jgi:hypothetical protein
MTCCGQPMTRDGSQYVCGKCGAWCDPGTVQAPAPVSARALLLALADRLDTRPSRPTDIHTVRGWARRLGLTSDWVGILPPPDGAHHSAYAHRLRTLAGGC